MARSAVVSLGSLSPTITSVNTEQYFTLTCCMPSKLPAWHLAASSTTGSIHASFAVVCTFLSGLPVSYSAAHGTAHSRHDGLQAAVGCCSGRALADGRRGIMAPAEQRRGVSSVAGQHVPVNIQSDSIPREGDMMYGAAPQTFTKSV